MQNYSVTPQYWTGTQSGYQQNLNTPPQIVINPQYGYQQNINMQPQSMMPGILYPNVVNPQNFVTTVNQTAEFNPPQVDITPQVPIPDQVDANNVQIPNQNQTYQNTNIIQPNYIGNNNINQTPVIQYNIYPQNINQYNVNQTNIPNMVYSNNNQVFQDKIINRQNNLIQYGNNKNNINYNTGYQNLNINNLNNSNNNSKVVTNNNNVGGGLEEIGKIETAYDNLISQLKTELEACQQKINDIYSLKKELQNKEFEYEQKILKFFNNKFNYSTDFYTKAESYIRNNNLNRISDFKYSSTIMNNLEFNKKSDLREMENERDNEINNIKYELNQMGNIDELKQKIEFCKNKIKSYEDEKLRLKTSILERAKNNLLSNYAVS